MATYTTPDQTGTAVGWSVDWRAVIAGALTAAAVSLVLLTFGSALGLSLVSAKPFAGLSATAVAMLGALWLLFVHVAGFVSGGYIAGRMRIPVSAIQGEREFRDGAHGALVWALGTLLGAYLLASTATGIASKTADAVGKAAEGAAVASVAASTNPSNSSVVSELVSYNVDRMLRPATAQQPPTSNPSLSARDTAEIARVFTVSLANGTLAPADKDYLSALVASRTGASQQEAARRVDESYAALEKKKAELEATARDVAEKARKSSVMVAFLAAAASLAGLVAASWAAGCGGHDRDSGRHHPAFMGRAARFW